uniref:Uncharacterized protein n=1 Tax=Setaria digitata TaxID=48799 RepID=A0A915Q0K2_9BILA
MGKCQCVVASLPAYTPQLIAFLIALLEFIIVVIAYIARETQRKKTFYGREDFEDIPEEEKMEHEGAIMGKNNEELRIVQSADRTAEIDVGSVTTPSAGGVKVMVRRKKAVLEQTDSRPKQITSAHIKTIRFTLDIDYTTRGFEFITLLQKALREVEEFKNIQSKLSDDVQDRLCDFLVRKMRTILEESTQRKWLVHGVIQNKIWKVNGLENLLEKCAGDIRTQQMLRVTAQGPMSPITILAYMVEIDVKLEQMHVQQSPASFITSKRSKSKMREESPTQSITRTFEKTPRVKPSPMTPNLTTPADITNYLTTMRTMSTMPSEKLPIMIDTFAHSQSSKKDTGYSPTNVKHVSGPTPSMSSPLVKQRRTLSTSYDRRKRSIGQTKKISIINRQKSSPNTDVRSRFRNHRSSEKAVTEHTQSDR